MKRFLIFFLFGQSAFSVDREEVWELFQPKSAELVIDQAQERKSSAPYSIDLDDDGKPENIIITFGDGHYFFSILRDSQFLSTHKIRVEGGESRIQRFFIEDIGKNHSSILIYIREGKFTTIDNLKKRRVDLITFDRADLTKTYYYEGPLISFEKKSWDGEISELKSSVYFDKIPSSKTKSLFIEDSNFSTTLKWSKVNKTWF